MVCVQEYLYTNRKNYSLSSITLFFSFLSFLYFIIPLLLYLSHLLNTTFNVSFFLYLAYFKFQSLSPLLFNFFFSIFACFSPLPVHYCHYFSVTNYLTHLPAIHSVIRTHVDTVTFTLVIFWSATAMSFFQNNSQGTGQNKILRTAATKRRMSEVFSLQQDNCENLNSRKSFSGNLFKFHFQTFRLLEENACHLSRDTFRILLKFRQVSLYRRMSIGAEVL